MAPGKKDAAPPDDRPASSAPTGDWRANLRAALDAAGPDFAAHVRGHEAEAWPFADTPELAGLERWGTELAARDRQAGVGALVRAAQHGFPRVIAAGGAELDNMGFHASEPSMDGAPVETQIALAAAWLAEPDAAHHAQVAEACDPSRQLHAWDDDLRPTDDHAYWWYFEVGQLCGYAITQATGDPASDSYYTWPSATCVGRGLVLAVRGLRGPGADLGAILVDVRAAMRG